MSEAGLTQTRQSTIDMTGTTASLFLADRPMKITRWGIVHTTALTTTAGLLTASVVEADATAATPTGASQGGTLTLPVATVGALNKGAYIEAEDFATTAPLTIVPGEGFSIVSDGLPATGAGIVFIEFEFLPFQDPNRPAADPGATTRATQLAAMTKLSS